MVVAKKFLILRRSSGKNVACAIKVVHCDFAYTHSSHWFLLVLTPLGYALSLWVRLHYAMQSQELLERVQPVYTWRDWTFATLNGHPFPNLEEFPMMLIATLLHML